MSITAKINALFGNSILCNVGKEKSLKIPVGRDGINPSTFAKLAVGDTIDFEGNLGTLEYAVNGVKQEGKYLAVANFKLIEHHQRPSGTFKPLTDSERAEQLAKSEEPAPY